MGDDLHATFFNKTSNLIHSIDNNRRPRNDEWDTTIMKHIRSVTVLGAGTMGSQIAAHTANAGIPTLLLDLDAKTAANGLARARKLKPDPFFTKHTYRTITVGGFDSHLAQVAESDWIVEAVVEQLAVKQELLRKVEQYRAQDTIVSSNTSGIPIATISEGFSDNFRQHWLGTHFFNPPRYLPLLEVIPTTDTKPEVLKTMVEFGYRALGKGVVVAKDTPNFIGNRVGLYGVMRVLDQLVNGNYTIEEIDAMTGPLLGRAKSATFRTLDIAGIDILTHVMNNLVTQLETDEERAAFELPPLIQDLNARGWHGQKTGQGFYQKMRTESGTEIVTLDPQTMKYRARTRPQLPALDNAQSIDDLGTRIRTLFTSKDRVGDFLRATLTPLLIYSAEVAPKIAHSIDDVDRAMRWGFGWELGPFELWDAIGIETVLRTAERSENPPALVQSLLEKTDGVIHFRPSQVEPAGPELQLLRRAKDSRPAVKQNQGASLIDLGDGILGLEFHSKMNSIGGDTINMMTRGVEEASKHFDALVIGNDGPAFSAGANLMLVLLEAQEENWDEIDLMIRSFQSAVLNLRYADVPVVVAPAGLTLGGGCEVVLHSDRAQAAAETYMGQVEVGVGLIPAGCGTKELLARFSDQAPAGAADRLPYIQRAFELIGFGTVSSSGTDAKQLGLLQDSDQITMNRERLLSDAKHTAIHLAKTGYRPPNRQTDIPVGGPDTKAALELGVHLAWRSGRISEYDVHLGRTLAHLLSGGDVPHATSVSEQYLLDLEREAFLSLCGQQKTQERISHTLKTGKTLRN